MLPQWIWQVMVLAVAIAPQFLTAQAAIEGTVPITGAAMSPPPSPKYQLKAGSVASSPRQVAVVYLEGKFASRPNEKTVTFAQKGYQFNPGVIAVQTGTRVSFPNYDDDYHNVFSYSRTKRFDLGRYRKDETPPALVFDKPGIVRLYCEIHEHMRGVILVVDTPHFTTSTPEGKFKLTGLPTGNYVLKAWLDDKTTLQRPVTLKSGTLKVDFSK